MIDNPSYSGSSNQSVVVVALFVFPVAESTTIEVVEENSYQRILSGVIAFDIDSLIWLCVTPQPGSVTSGADTRNCALFASVIVNVPLATAQVVVPLSVTE